MSGLFTAIVDALMGSDEQIAGQAITVLRVGLDDTSTDVLVESTVGFGEYTDGTGNARIIVGSEIIDCGTRTVDEFGTLTRGVGSTRVRARYPAGTVVYDGAQNTSAVDLARRGFLVDFAIGADLDQIGRNLGLHRCEGMVDDTWRAVIKAIAYLAKGPPSAIITALEALFGPSGYVFYERLVSSPNRFFVQTAVTLADSLQGRFVLNPGEPQLVEAAGVVNVDYPITASPFEGNEASGNIRVVSGAFLIDGENFVLDDGVNPAVTFEFDNNASVVEVATLRAVVFTPTSTEEQVRDAIIAAIAGAPALDITASVTNGQNVGLDNDTIGVLGNQTITTTVADSVFAVTGMAGGADAGTLGVFGVFDDTPLTREGIRETFTNYFTGGSFVGSAITLGTDPGLGVAVIVDYNAHPAHYLAPDETFMNDGTDYPPYLSDNLGTASCLLDQVRAAGVGVELSAGL